MSWKNVSQNHPCPICGKPDWCSSSGDGLAFICRRVYSPEALVKYDRNGNPYYLYCDSRGDIPVPETEPGVEIPRAEPSCLHRMYSILLNMYPLQPQHTDNLLRRGLTPEEIRNRKYGSLVSGNRMKMARWFLDRYGAEECIRVPGLVYHEDEEKGPRWFVSGPSGILIPVRNGNQEIVALKIRVDDPGDGGKYRYMTSRSYGGPGPGSPVHVPLYESRSTETVRVTEGELKADVATALTPIVTLSIPGVSCWNSVFPVLHHMHTKKVLVAFDQDAQSNPVVAGNLLSFVRKLKEKNLPFHLEKF